MTGEPSYLTRWQLAIRDSRRLSSAARCVGWAMSTRMDVDGTIPTWCYPSAYTLRDDTRLGLRTVRYALAELVAETLLEMVERGGSAAAGRRRPTIYRAKVPTGAPGAPVQVVHGSGTGAGGAPVHLVHGTGAPGAPLPCQDHSPFDAEFAEAWVVYPRKLARKAALKAYQTRRRAGVPADELLTATRNYADAKRGSDEKFILHGSTFFGPDERWRDYLVWSPSSEADPYDAPEPAYR